MINLKRCSACRIEKDLGLFTLKNNQCKECRKVTSKKYREANKEKCLAASKASELKNPKIKERHKRYRENNPESVKRKAEKYKAKNPEHYKNLIRQWAINNHDKRSAACSKRRAIKLKAMPKWADQNKIRLIYKHAVTLTKETGVLHVVDHIYPLQSKLMCGLHIDINLRVITQTENLVKGNKITVNI